MLESWLETLFPPSSWLRELEEELLELEEELPDDAVFSF